MASHRYNWNDPKDEDLLAMAQVITKYIRFIDPSVVSAITQDNRKHAKCWHARLEARGIDPRLYLWDGSPCCFPGIRRYRKAQEKAWYLNIEEKPLSFPHALELDFNEYPKEICTYLFGDNLDTIVRNYSLMHILSHGEITNQVWLEIPGNEHFLEKGIYGLFTSPANTIYAPNSIVNIINTNPKLKGLLAERELKLYRHICSIVPRGVQLRTKREERGEEWHIDRFEWATCFGGGIPMQDFLAYRQDKMERLLGGARQIIITVQKSPGISASVV